jgi:hypothetical protein
MKPFILAFLLFSIQALAQETKTVEGSSSEGATDKELCKNAVKDGMIAAKPWMGCRPVSGTLRILRPFGAESFKSCKISIQCDLNPEEALKVSEMATGLTAACQTAENSLKIDYEKSTQLKEKEYKKLRKQASINKKDKKQRKLREMQLAIQQSNHIMRNLREWNLETLRDYIGRRMKPQFLFETLKIRLPLNKDKFGHADKKYQVINESCSDNKKDDCVLAISTSFPYKRVVELKVAQSDPRKVTLKVCYGTPLPHAKNGGACVERVESETVKQLSHQDYFFDAEYYFARSEWKSIPEYAQKNGKNFADCTMLTKLHEKVAYPAQYFDAVIKKDLEKRSKTLRQLHKAQQGSKTGY